VLALVDLRQEHRELFIVYPARPLHSVFAPLIVGIAVADVGCSTRGTRGFGPV
jgi:hypothetical protein